VGSKQFKQNATARRRAPKLGLLRPKCRVFRRHLSTYVGQPNQKVNSARLMVYGKQLAAHWHQRRRADSIDEQIELQTGFNRNQGPEQAKPYRFTQEARGSFDDTHWDRQGWQQRDSNVQQLQLVRFSSGEDEGNKSRMPY
jgi:hypothetical protein